MIKISDVAKHAGVSVSTVSRVLNKDKDFAVSDETIKKVHDSVKKLGYKPLRKRTKSNPVSKKKMRNIAIIMTVSKEGETKDPYWTSIRVGVEQKAIEYGLSVVKIIRLQELTDDFSVDDIDGAVIIGNILPQSIEYLGLSKKNTVLINNSIMDMEGYDRVSSNLYQATVKSIDILQELGHQEIGFVGGVDYVSDLYSNQAVKQDDMRLSAFQEYFRDDSQVSNNILLCDWTTQDGYQIMKDEIKSKPVKSAYIVASDPIAMGVIRALTEENLNVPNDVSIISFDDIDAAAFLNPPLSSVNLHTEEMGRQAVNLLDERLNGRTIAVNISVQPKIIIRNSIKRKN